jgi:hypothetical protein
MQLKLDEWVPVVLTNPGLNFLSGPNPELTDEYRVRCRMHSYPPSSRCLEHTILLPSVTMRMRGLPDPTTKRSLDAGGDQRVSEYQLGENAA